MLTDLATLHRDGKIDFPSWFELAVRLQRLAVDMETGAYLIASAGRGKGGRNKYYLVSGTTRLLLRAATDAEAVKKGIELS